MPFTAYCKIKDIPGESGDKAHTNEIKIREYSHHVSQKCKMGDQSGGLMAQGADFGLFKIAHILDKATANLNLFCIKGMPIAEIEITVKHAVGGQKPFMKYVLKKCLITEVSVVADANADHESPLEYITFAYNEINWTYTAYKNDGSKDGEYTAGWKLDTNE